MSEVLALYAAILSTALLIAELHEKWANRRRLVVLAHAYTSDMESLPDEVDPRRSINILCRNIGSRPITVESVEMAFKGGSTMFQRLALPNNPKSLEEADITDGKARWFEIVLPSDFEDASNVTSVVVTDQTGREWPARIKVFTD